MRSYSGAALTAVAALALSSLSTTACTQAGMLKALKNDKEANQAYQQGDYAKAAALYEEAIAAAPDEPRIVSAYFFLGNSYDQMYRPSKKGDPANDSNLDKAVKYYDLASQKLEPNGNPPRSLALKYLVATYGTEKLNDPVKAEPVVIRMIQLDPNDLENYFALANIYEQAGVYDEAEKMYLMAKNAKPNDATAYLQLSGFYQRQGEFDKQIESLVQRAEKEPTNPEAYQTIAGNYYNEVLHNGGLRENVKKEYIDKGLQASDKALQLKPDYADAMTFKGLLLRSEATIEKDPEKQKQLIKQGEDLSNKANEIVRGGAKKT
jgi:tetratricopeptide (TPR) repeat protein